jgi:hypothetical protein
MVNLLMIAYFLVVFLECNPSNIIFVGKSDSSSDGDSCGNNQDFPCETLIYGYSRSSSNSGDDRCVEICSDIIISDSITLSDGGTFYTYGGIKSETKVKVSGDSTFHINGDSDTSWFLF